MFNYKIQIHLFRSLYSVTCKKVARSSEFRIQGRKCDEECNSFTFLQGQLLPNVFKSHAWGILHTLLEMFSYRMHHIQPHYRVQLLSHLHSLAAVSQTNQNQLHLW